MWESINIFQFANLDSLSVLGSEWSPFEEDIFLFVWLILSPFEVCSSILELVQVIIVILTICSRLILWTIVRFFFVAWTLGRDTIFLFIISNISTWHTARFNWTVIPCWWIKAHLPFIVFLWDNGVWLFDGALFIASCVDFCTFYCWNWIKISNVFTTSKFLMHCWAIKFAVSISYTVHWLLKALWVRNIIRFIPQSCLLLQIRVSSYKDIENFTSIVALINANHLSFKWLCLFNLVRSIFWRLDSLTILMNLNSYLIIPTDCWVLHWSIIWG